MPPDVEDSGGSEVILRWLLRAECPCWILMEID